MDNLAELGSSVEVGSQVGHMDLEDSHLAVGMRLVAGNPLGSGLELVKENKVSI